MARQPERTLLIIKPDAVKRGLIGAIISRLEQAGFNITRIIMKQLSRPEAEGFYAIHRGKEFFSGLVEFITSGPVVALLIEGAGCQHRLREFVGATDPAKAQPGTIRADFGTSVRMNAVHASNPEEDVDREINFFFPDQNQNPK
ncbi:MAG: nucleoside-diphosphate kinase [candidate division WOR-3 bacterium]|jgi:nucleoside-diphosphate kinase|nr:nucleoside-diphosphate kinase [candidate division WOR-3 bacterium]MCR4423883.1 nucleoside-diphosphate kinase [candidate division WOR-3 bacterium]MDH7519221.1 nucleoside-diphosphate kinase [bacterium]